MDKIQKFIEEAKGLRNFVIPHAISNERGLIDLYYAPKDYEYYLQCLNKALSALDMLEVMHGRLEWIGLDHDIRTNNFAEAEYWANQFRLARDRSQEALQECEEIAGVVKND